MRLISFTVRGAIPAPSAHASLDDPLAPVPEREEPDDTEREQHQDAVEAVLLDRLGGRLAGPVGEQAETPVAQTMPPAAFQMKNATSACG